MEHKHPQSQPVHTEAPGCLTVFIPFIWRVFGNLGLFFAAAFIAQRQGGVAIDVVFWLIAVGLVIARYVDIAKFHGLTMDYEPATMKHWLRYTMILVPIAAMLWVGAHLIARAH